MALPLAAWLLAACGLVDSAKTSSLPSTATVTVPVGLAASSVDSAGNHAESIPSGVDVTSVRVTVQDATFHLTLTTPTAIDPGSWSHTGSPDWGAILWPPAASHPTEEIFAGFGPAPGVWLCGPENLAIATPLRLPTRANPAFGEQCSISLHSKVVVSGTTVQIAVPTADLSGLPPSFQWVAFIQWSDLISQHEFLTFVPVQPKSYTAWPPSRATYPSR